MRLAAAMQWRWSGLAKGAAAGRRVGWRAQLGLLGAVLALLTAAPASAQEAELVAPKAAQIPVPAPVLTPQQVQRLKLNQETLIVAAGRPGTSYLAMAGDLASSFGAAGNVRLLPVATEGGLGSLKDVLLLRGVDLGIVPGNVLAHARTSNTLGIGLPQRIAYVTVLYGEEVHVVAGQGIAALADLSGKRVAIPGDDAAAQFTARDILQRLAVAADCVPTEQARAVDEVRSGAVAAAVLVGGKPLAQIAALPKDGSVRLLGVGSGPGSSAVLAEGYSPAVLRSEDYPALIPPGAMVETVAVNAVLVANKASDETVRRLAKHAPALLEAIAQLAQSQRHPKWRDVNLAAVLPGWTRVEAAETWLNRASAQRKELLQERHDDSARPERRGKPSDTAAPGRKKLFDEFEAWARKSVASQPDAK
jgi:TRAP-type uncharacterized transport system substrate-binding protein